MPSIISGTNERSRFARALLAGLTFFLLLIAVTSFAQAQEAPPETPTPTPAATESATAAPTESATTSPTETATPPAATATPSASPLPTTGPTPTAAPTPIATPTPTATATATATPSVTVTTTPTASPTATPTVTPTPIPGPTASLIVKLVPGLTPLDQAAVITRNGGTQVSTIAPLRMHVVNVPAATVDQAIARFDADPQVANVEREKVRATDAEPSDTSYGVQWALPKVGWDLVFGTVAPAGTARLAVLDTGIDTTDPDLAGRVVAGYSAFPGTSPTADPNGHGTALASIAAATTDNATGIAGVAYAGVSLMSVRVLDAAGLGQDSDIIEGIVWATDNGADVILMGFSNPGFSPSLQDAVDYAWSSGVVLVAATGNDSTSEPTYPAGDAGVMGVSATDEADALWSGSNYGAATFIAAPGVGIATSDGSITGTSASAAMVAGAAALLAANDPTATNDVIVGRLARTADPAGTPAQTGNGRLNLARALEDTSTVGVTPIGAPGGGPFVGPYVVAANNDAHVAPGWAPTNTVTTFSTLYRVTDPGTVQHVRITLPVGYTNIIAGATAFSSGTWSAPAVNSGLRRVDVSLTSGTGLVVGGWARVDVTATTPLANQSGAAAEWLMETFTNAAGTGGANEDDNPPVLIGTVTNPAATITFVDSVGTPIVSPVLQNAVAATVRVRINSISSGGTTIKYTDVAVPTCFSTPTSVTTTSSAGGNGGYSPVVTDGFIRMPGGQIPNNGFLTVQFTTTPNCVSGTYLVSSTPSTNATNPPSGTNQSVSTSGGSLTVAAGLADLSITKTDSPDPVEPEATLTYTIGVSNAGPDPASAVKVVDTLPVGTTFDSATGTDWNCTDASGTVTCNRTAGNLAPGAAPNITITVTAPSTPGSLTNSATVSSPNDNTPANNAATATTAVKAPLTITANDATKTYGDTVTFAGTEFTTVGLLGGDSVTSVTLTSTGAAATATVAGSPYAIVASAAVGTGLGNYTISYVDGALTVDPKDLTVTADDRTKTYGDTVTFLGTEFTTLGLVNADAVNTVTLTSTGAAATATVAGSPYAIVASAAVGTGLGNYTISYVDGALTVDPKDLTVTADDRTKTYGDTVTFLGTEFTTLGLVNADAVNTVTLTSTGAAATATVAGSPYAIVASAAVGTGLGNYTISYVDGALTVDPKDLTVTADDRTKTYGDTVTFLGTEFTTLGLVNADAVNTVTLTSTGAAATATVAGSPYAIVASAAVGTGLGNYTISYVDGALTVDPKDLTVTADDRTKTYGDTVTFLGTEFTTLGLVNADAVNTVTLTSTGAAATATVAGSPYAIVASAAVGTGLGNYTISYVDGALTVDPKDLTVTADDRTKTYGDTVTFLGTEFTTVGLVNADAVNTVTLTSTGAPATATVAGSPYAIVASAAVGTGLGNYTISYVDGALTVDPKDLTVTADDRTKTYGDTVTFLGTEFTTVGLVNADAVNTVTLTSTGAAATATVAGSPYAIVASAAVGTGLGNYTISYVDGALTVDPKGLTVTADDRTKTYGDTVTFLGTEFTTVGLVNSDAVNTVTLTSTGAAATATVAGSPYAIVASAAVGTGLGNYTISYVDGALTVDPKDLTVTADDRTKTYGDTVTFLGTEFTTLGLVNADAVNTVTLTSTGAAATATVAGSPYAIVASAAVGTGLGNYTISYVDGALTVDPKDLTVTADDRTKTYGDTVTFLGTEFTTLGLVNADAVNTVTLTSTGAAATATVAGSPYAIVASAAVGTGLGNYTISYVDGALTVDPKDLTVTADDRTKTYGDTVTFLGTEFTTLGLVNADAVNTVTLTSTGAAATATVAGSPYAIVASAAVGTGLGNYTISYVDGALTVDPKDLTVTADDRTKTYGDTVTFLGTEFTTLGLVNADAVNTVTLTSTGAAATATVAGSPYAIVASAAVGTGLGNYTISYVDGALTVDPKDLTVTADDRTKTYGDTVTFLGTEFTTLGLVNSDAVNTVTLTSTGAAATATVAGSPYAIVASAAVGTGLGNYTISYVDGALTVDPKDLTVTADDRTKTYGDTVTFLGTEFTTVGLVNADAVNTVTLTSTGAPATATVAGSPYAIVASAAVGTGLGNYTISYVDGALTVDPKDLTVTADDRTKTYGDTVTFLGTEFTTLGLVNADAVNTVTLTSTGAAATATVAGSPYAIVASAAVGTGLGNYTISYVDGDLTVDPKGLTVTADDRTKTYGDTVTFLGTEFTTVGLVNSDAVNTVTLTSTGAAATATVAGSPYAIVASAAVGTGLGNYTISYVDGALTVDPKDLTVTADDRTKTYGDTVTFLGTEFTTLGLVNGDAVNTVTLTSTGAAATATVAGSPYAIVASAAVGTGLGNYTISYVDGALTVDPKDLTVTADDRTKTYGDTVTFLGTEFTTLGLVNADAVNTVTLTSTGAAATATVAGSPYAIVASAAVGTGLGNYTISYVDGALTVDPKDLTVTADDRTKTYGDTVTFLGTEFTTLGLVNADAVNTVTLTSTGAAATATVAGSPYAIVASAAVGTGLGNYTISYVDGDLTVDPKDLTVTADDRTKTYGDTVTFLGTEFTTLGLVNADAVNTVTLTSTGAAATATVAGSPYAIVASAAVGTGLGNYTISYVDGALTVDPKDLTVTADDRTKTYGDTVTFLGTEFTTVGLVNADAVNTVTLTSTGAPATETVAGSPYAIVASAAVGTGLGNYTISHVDGALTVDKADAMIVVTGYDVTYDAQPHTASGTATGVLGESLVGLDLSGTTHSNAGSYPTDPWTFTDVTGNYNDDSGTVADNIDKAPSSTATEIHLEPSHAVVTSPILANSTVHARATVGDQIGSSPMGGNLTFTFWTNGTCTGPGTDAATVGLDLTNAAYPSSSKGPLISGTYAFRAQYNGGANYNGSQSNCEALTVDLRLTQTTVMCVPILVQIGTSTVCTATVTDIDAGVKSDPTGMVAFTSNASAINAFSAAIGYTFAGPGSCTLVPDGSAFTFTASCSVKYTQYATGTPTITAGYVGSNVHLPSSDSLILSVYDPSGGFVTGGGWIISPAGACVSPDVAVCANSLATGKANFGFNAKYKPGASAPTGQTEFQFKAGNLNFHSSSYEVLIVTGQCKAQFKGTGTINGVAGYKFVLTAYDSQSGGGGKCAGKSTDSFRIRITNIGSGSVIYDNRFDNSADPDDIEVADPQAIAGGSIVIHK